jgi:hypothetical protein
MVQTKLDLSDRELSVMDHHCHLHLTLLAPRFWLCNLQSSAISGSGSETPGSAALQALLCWLCNLVLCDSMALLAPQLCGSWLWLLLALLAPQALQAPVIWLFWLTMALWPCNLLALTAPMVCSLRSVITRCGLCDLRSCGSTLRYDLRCCCDNAICSLRYLLALRSLQSQWSAIRIAICGHELCDL